MDGIKRSKTLTPAKAKGFKFTGSNQDIRREVLNRNMTTNKISLCQPTVIPKYANESIHFNVNRKKQCGASLSFHATDSRENQERISSLVLNKWPMPIHSHSVDGVQSSDTMDTAESSTPHEKSIKEPIIKNIQINGRTLPLKFLKIFPATSSQLCDSNTPILCIRPRYSSPSSGDEQESVMGNGISNLDGQSDLRVELKRIEKQKAHILAQIMNHSVSFSRRLKEMKDVDELEAKIQTNREKQNLANYMRKRIKNKTDAVMEIVERLFAPGLITKFHVSGMRKERSFKKLELNSVIQALSGLTEKHYYVELARSIHTISARFSRVQKKKQTQQ